MLQVNMKTAWGAIIAFAYVTILCVQWDITTVLGDFTVHLAGIVAASNVCLLC